MAFSVLIRLITVGLKLGLRSSFEDQDEDRSARKTVALVQMSGLVWVHDERLIVHLSTAKGLAPLPRFLLIEDSGQQRLSRRLPHRSKGNRARWYRAS